MSTGSSSTADGSSRRSSAPDRAPLTVVGLCVDGPMAGTEVTVAVGANGQPTEVVAVGAHTYQLAMQSDPVAGRLWRYTVVRAGELLVIDGAGQQPDGD